MKISKACLALLLALCLCAGGVSAFAAGKQWSEEYYRASDVTDALTDEQQEELDEKCIDFMKTYRLDLALLAVTPEYYEDETLEEHAKGYYESCGFGYGDTHDGFLWLYDAEEQQVELFCFGAAEGRVSQSFIDKMKLSAPEIAKEHGVYGVLYIGIKYLSGYLDEFPADGDKSDEPARQEDGNVSLPDWYPDDPEHFVFFHDETAPRVVDAADIFTDAEEQRLEARLGEIRAELQKDLVIYTDMTDYGLTQAICAADFFDFNGYGCGDEYEGACLFIDMDPDERGWWCACTGAETKGLYTEDVANLIDDALYEYMAAGKYADGVANWAENFRTLYRKGSPFAPDWYPAHGETLTPFHDPNAPRVVDEIGLLTDAEAAELTKRAAAISQKYGVDVAIHTMVSPWGMNYDEVTRLYYTHMGYGYGDNYDGILLNVFKREGYYAAPRVMGFGSVAGKLTEVNHERLLDYFKGYSTEDHYYRGADQWLKHVDHMLCTGRVARSTGYWILIALLGLFVGSIAGGIALARAKKKMETPREKRDADAYIDSAASRIVDAGRALLYTTTSRRYIPRQESSSGSSGGGSSSHRSSYSSSYHGSSGRSHSGSGRRF